MNDWIFNECRNFLESMINKEPENKELIQAYIKLIEKKTESDIAYFKIHAEVKKDWEKNQTERIKANTEVTKKLIEKGIDITEYQSRTGYW